MGSRDVDGIMMLVDNAITAMAAEVIALRGNPTPTRDEVLHHELEQEEALVLAGTGLLRFALTRFDELVDAMQEIAAQGRDKYYVPEQGGIT